MIQLVVRATPLLALYLLTLGSAKPGDVVIGGVLALLIAASVRPLLPPGTAQTGTLPRRVAAFAWLVISTIAGAIGATWRVVPLCLFGRGSDHAGLVELPIGERSPAAIAAWGVRTGLTPDEVVVDVDWERGLLLVHALDASDPDAMRARYEDDYQHRQRRVFP